MRLSSVAEVVIKTLAQGVWTIESWITLKQQCIQGGRTPLKLILRKYGLHAVHRFVTLYDLMLNEGFRENTSLIHT